MRTVKVAHTRWSDYLALVTREDAGAETRVRAVHAPSAQRKPIALPLQEISIEARTGSVELRVAAADPNGPALRYYVETPREMLAIERRGLRTILIVDAAGLQTLIHITRRAITASAPHVRSGRSSHRPSCRVADDRRRSGTETLSRSDGHGARWSRRWR